MKPSRAFTIRAAGSTILWQLSEKIHADAKRRGVQLASGQSAAVFRQVMQTVGMTPVEAMEKIINSERYEAITVA